MIIPKGCDSFEESVQIFLNSAHWLTEEDEPMTTSLLIMARQLDKRFSAATMAQFGLSYRFLAKRRPTDERTTDPLELLLGAE